MKPGEQKSNQEEAELETQLVLRMPEESAKVLREAIQTGATNLKDRLNIKLEQDLRYGELRFDDWLYHIKVVDLPTVIESLKTIDLKSFYKTADICQMMICREEPEVEVEEESPTKNKKKDSNKVDKKFLWPHGITPPCKNVRKRRFRKTLKKKYVEAPEIEKEVKRLLRVDNEAVNVKWEIIMEDEEVTKGMSADRPSDSKPTKGKKNRQHHASLLTNDDTASNTAGTSRGDVGEHEIFGEELSDSDEDNNANLDLDIESRMFDGHSDSNNSGNEAGGSRLTTEFNRDMFMKPKAENSDNFYHNDSDDGDEPPLSQDAAKSKITELERQLSELRAQRVQLEQQVASIENQTLRQRLQDNLDALLSQILDKEMEMQDLEMNLF